MSEQAPSKYLVLNGPIDSLDVSIPFLPIRRGRKVGIVMLVSGSMPECMDAGYEIQAISFHKFTKHVESTLRYGRGQKSREILPLIKYKWRFFPVGRFYFGELVEDDTGCDEDVSVLHAGIAEVAAAKAWMFVKKPDGNETPEFVLVIKGPEPDPEDPLKLPLLKDGEEVDPKKVEFLPLGFDEFYGRNVDAKKKNLWMRVVSAVENACKPIFENVEKWTEEKRKAGELKLKLIEKELELVEAELCLEEVIEDVDEELKRREKEEEKVEIGLQEDEDTSAASAKQDEKPLVEEDEDEEEEEEEDEDEDDVAPSSFGSATADQDATKNGQRGNNLVPSRLQQSFSTWKKSRAMPNATIPSCNDDSSCLSAVSVSFPPVVGPVNLKATSQRQLNFEAKNFSNGRLCRIRPISQLCSPHSTSMDTRM
ncbi:hypothetical protein C1H46_001078 [Malus baccata]|uniref:Uncharacterized protein n=1 Tax=Malus baccata TaxID=106549 RepID=A0A540NQH4_MALBA|nr:hypothetical protein C1H46_001078 [Malus baccata]